MRTVLDTALFGTGVKNTKKKWIRVMRPFNPDLPWDCRHCEFHNAFCSHVCSKCNEPRDFHFMCLQSQLCMLLTL